MTFGTVAKGHGLRIGLYGPGGIGKTSLAATAPGPVAFFDLDDSLPVLAEQLDGLDVRPVAGVTSWQDVRSALSGEGWDGIGTIVVDTATRAEELALAYTLATVPHEKGQRVERIEDYGYGKGYTYLFETFMTLLGDLDQHVKAGRNVILVMHDCTSAVPNPMGDDWIRYEPRLSSPASGKSSIRLRVREWLDHLLFVGYDVDVNKDGKGKGQGTRTVYPVEMPWCMAKSRRLDMPVPLVKGDSELWNMIFGQGDA
ncbi:MAG: ATP-binding protein [Planctomycetes bacterium]|nr:ATP-binding protein [Planctomycetota bacterium]